MFCSKCGKEITGNLYNCPHCGNPVAVPSVPPPPIYVQQVQQKSGCGKTIGCAIAVLFGLGMMGGIIGSITSQQSESTSDSENTSGGENKATPVTTETAQAPSKFDGDCGISASAHLSSDIINHPQLKINVRNTSGKAIRAIQFYSVPYDVYGEEIDSFMFTQKKLYTDDLIPSGKSKTLTFGPFLLSNIKSVKLYVYSVYYDDGTEWGDKEAISSEILKFAKPIEATFEK